MKRLSSSRRQLVTAAAASLLAARLPAVARGEDGTPEAIGETSPAPDAGGSLAAMLERAYDPIPDGGTPPTMLFTYADIARQLEVRGLRGLDPEVKDNDRLSEWNDGVDGLYLDDVVARRAFQHELWEMVGFNLSQVTQTMTIGDPPSTVRIYRGTFDVAQISEALTETGYETMETRAGTVWSIGEDGQFSAGHPLQRLVLNAFNNIAATETHVVAAGMLVDLEAAFDAVTGSEATLGNNRAVQTMLSAVDEELVSAVMIHGSFLSAGSLPDFTREGQPTAVPTKPIPPAAYALFGITPGSMPSRYADEDPQLQGTHDDAVPRSAFVIGLHLGSEAEAASAAPVIDARLAEGTSVLTGQPYADLFGAWEVEAVAGSPVVKVRITGERVGRIWLRAVLSLDLAFLYTE